MLRLVINAIGTNRNSYSDKSLMEARMRTKYSIRCLLSASMIILIFSGIDCRRNPVGPPPGADTTSNNFTFQTFTFGAANGGSSYLQDVAVINDTDAWAVGAIYLDSADGAPDPFPYNAVHWDGQKWTPLKVPYLYQGQPFYHPIEAVFALASNDVWFGGNGLEHWDGKQFSNVDAVNPFWSGNSMQRIWASSDNDIYIVGSGGTIAHYASGTWTNIASGTDLYFNDIYGAGGQILATCLTNYSSDNWGPGIFSIQGNTATRISTNPIQDGLYGIWFAANQHYYVADADIYQKQLLSDSAWSPLGLSGTATGVRGNGTSDVFVVSASGDVLHWNGAGWKSFKAETGLSNGGYSSVAVNGNTVVGVGQNNVNFGQAVITMGIRH
jgi:hypothetical protein